MVAKDAARPSDPYAPGATVRVESYGAEGQVLERRGDQVLVQLGLLKVEVPVTDAKPVAAEPARTTGRSKGRAPGGERRVSVDIGTASFDRELNIRGERVEQALETIRDFVLEARSLKVESVRILHGKGTGALRDAVRNYLRTDRNVERFEDAVPYEGGHGVTVAYLRP